MAPLPVLAIEDRAEIRQALISLSEHTGYSALGIVCCHEGHEPAHRHAFKLILLDLKLLDGNGL
jgi:DNA-binding response OmpR family regulator